MRDRLKDVQITSRPARKQAGSASGNRIEDAVSALIALGYKPQEASRYVHAVAAPEMNSEAIIREALKASVNK